MVCEVCGRFAQSKVALDATTKHALMKRVREHTCITHRSTTFDLIKTFTWAKASKRK